MLQRPFEAHNHEMLSQKIMKADVPFPVTNPPVSMPCLHAISSLLERDRKQRIGAVSWVSFYDNPFFRPIDFEALERKEIPPVFLPSSEKTNFDATYDLEELLLEEAPLEARARRQKPREALKQDATDAEIRAEELHRMIETMFEPFDFTIAQYDKDQVGDTTPTSAANGSASSPKQKPGSADGKDGLKVTATPIQTRSRSSTQSPNGSPPLPTVSLEPVSKGSQRASPDHVQEPAGDPKHTQTRDRPEKRQKGMTRTASAGGGSQYIVHATGSWSELAQPSSSHGEGEEDKDRRPTGMLGFLSRKKGRDRSPKARERGVLGKEGARVIINNG